MSRENGARKLLRKVPKERRIYIRGHITDQQAKRVVSKLRKFDKNWSLPILLYVNSESGGDSGPVLEIFNAIRKCRAPVYAKVANAYSGALVILVACDKVIGRDNSRYRMHFNRLKVPLYVWAYMDMELWTKNVREIAQTLEQGLRENWHKNVHQAFMDKILKAGKSQEEFFQLLHEDRTISVEEALEWGFIDEIVRN